MDRNSLAVMRAHSWARRAPRGWKSRNPGMIWSTIPDMRSDSSMRGSVS